MPRQTNDEERLPQEGLGDLLKEIWALEPDARESLISELAEGAGSKSMHALGQRAEQLRELEVMLPCLEKHEIPALTADSSTFPGFFRGEVVQRLTAHFDALEDADEAYTRCFAFCGDLGKRCLAESRERVNRARRERNLPLLDAVLDLHRQLRAKDAQKLPDEIDKEVVAMLRKATKELGRDLAKERRGTFEQRYLLGLLTVRDLKVLRECNTYLQDQYASIYYGPHDKYLRQLLRMFTKWRRRGYGPITAEREAKYPKQPNVLYPDPSGRGPDRWGGIYAAEPREETRYRPVQKGWRVPPAATGEGVQRQFYPGIPDYAMEEYTMTVEKARPNLAEKIREEWGISENEVEALNKYAAHLLMLSNS